MSAADLSELLEACKATPVMYLSGGIPMYKSPQENANAAWETLGKKMGFDPTTVLPIAGQPQTFFLAEPSRPDFGECQ